MSALAIEPYVDTRCPGCGIENGKPVPSRLLRQPKGERIAIIGEAPGEQEHLRGEPFIGLSGQILRGTLSQVGYDLDEMFVTNVMCCRPPGNRTPTPEEIDGFCRKRLIGELETFQPNKILALGNTAIAGLFGTDFAKTNKILRTRGAWMESKHLPGVKVMPSIHPAALIREASPFLDFCRDIERLRDEKGTECKPTINVHVVASNKDLNVVIQRKLNPSEPTLFTIDIETTGFDPKTCRVLSIGISPNETDSYIIPDKVFEVKGAKETLQKLFDNPNITWAGHNAINFDRAFLKEALGLVVPIEVDSMLQHYLVDERRGTHGLKQIARDYYGMSDWSAEVKQYVQGEGATYENIPRDKLYHYQAIDTTVNYRLAVSLKSQMQEGRLQEAYEKVIRPAAYMLQEVEQVGGLLDAPYLQALEKRWVTEIAERTDKIREQLNKAKLNVRSSKQVAELIFDDMGFDEDPKLGRSTGKAILKKLGLKDDSGVLEEIIDLRSMSQNLSTYVRGLQKRVGPDGRIRPHLLLHGTETGRLACQNPNLMNIPKHRGPVIRNGFITTPGWRLMEFDFSQLEFRIAAWYSQDPKLIAAFSSGHDFHKSTAAITLGKPIENVTKEERFQAKFINFGILYGRGAHSIAEELKWTVRQAQTFIDKFLGTFPHLNEWLVRTREGAFKNGYVENAFGQRRRFPLALPSNRGNIEREAVNTPIQGMASHINILAMCKIHNTFDHNKLRCLWPVHDSILMEVREAYADEYFPLVQAIMEDTESLGVEQRLPITASGVIADRWGDCTDD